MGILFVIIQSPVSRLLLPLNPQRTCFVSKAKTAITHSLFAAHIDRIPPSTINFETECDNSDRLCERCLKIDFHQLFPKSARKRNSHYGVVNLGVLDEDTTCKLRRFFYSVRWPQTLTPASPSFDHYHFRVFTWADVSIYSFPKVTLGRDVVCSVVPGHNAEFTDDILKNCQNAYYNVRGPKDSGQTAVSFPVKSHRQRAHHPSTAVE